MALPLPRVVSDVGPGGGLVTAMRGMNSLANDMILRKINAVKAQYAPLTTQAEAASKLAYANLMGPQFLAKLLGNEGAVANMGDPAAKAALQKAIGAGMGQGSGSNIFNQMQQGQGLPTGIGQPSTNSFSGYLQNSLKGLFGQSPQQSSNPFAQMGGQQPMLQAQPQQEQTQQHGMDSGRGHQEYNPDQEDPINHEIDAAFMDWAETPEGKAAIDSGDPKRMPSGQKLLNWSRAQQGIPPKTYAENTADYKGTLKQGEEGGKYRAEALKNIGESQLGLSNSGAVLDRMTGIIKNPVFANMRNTIPGFQNKQLDYLKVMGTPEQKELIGDFLSTGESFIASTVQGFSGKPLVREFDLAQRQKITGHDTIESATGKLRSARTLHDIAEQKNQIVSELLDKGYNEAEAVKQANKMIDVSAIEKATNESLQRKIEIKNSKTGEKKMVTIEEARKLGVPNV